MPILGLIASGLSWLSSGAAQSPASARLSAEQTDGPAVALVGFSADDARTDMAQRAISSLGGRVHNEPGADESCSFVVISPTVQETQLFAACLRGKRVFSLRHLEACQAQGRWMEVTFGGEDDAIADRLDRASQRWAALRTSNGAADTLGGTYSKPDCNKDSGAFFCDSDEDDDVAECDGNGGKSVGSALPFAGWKAVVLLPNALLRDDIVRAIIAGGGNIVTSLADAPTHAIVDDSRTIDDASDLLQAASAGCLCLAWRFVRDVVMMPKPPKADHYSIFEDDQQGSQPIRSDHVTATHAPPQSPSAPITASVTGSVTGVAVTPERTPNNSAVQSAPTPRHLTLTPALRSKRPAADSSGAPPKRRKNMLMGQAGMVDASIDDREYAFAVALTRAIVNPAVCPPPALAKRLFVEGILSKRASAADASIPLRTAALLGMCEFVHPRSEWGSTTEVVGAAAAVDSRTAKENSADPPAVLSIARPPTKGPSHWNFLCDTAHAADTWQVVRDAMACPDAGARGEAIALIASSLTREYESHMTAASARNSAVVALAKHVGLRDLAGSLCERLAVAVAEDDRATLAPIQRLIALAYECAPHALSTAATEGKPATVRQPRRALQPRQQDTPNPPSATSATRRGAAKTYAQTPAEVHVQPSGDACCIQRSAMVTVLASHFDALLERSTLLHARVLLDSCESADLLCSTGELLIARHCDGMSSLPDALTQMPFTERLAQYLDLAPSRGRKTSIAAWVERYAALLATVVSSAIASGRLQKGEILPSIVKSASNHITAHAGRTWGVVVTASVARMEAAIACALMN